MLPLSEHYLDYASQVADKLNAAGLRVETDDRNEKIGYKIREAQMQKVPYMLVIGEKEVESGNISVRDRAEGDLGMMPLDDFIQKVQTAD